MRILDRYIGQTVAFSTLTVMVVILSLFTFFTFAGELNKTGRGNYDTLEAVQYALLTMPSMLYQLFPTAVLIGTMGGLGALMSSSELVAMRSAGYSLVNILRSVFAFGLLMMTVLLLLKMDSIHKPIQHRQTLAQTNKNQCLLTSPIKFDAPHSYCGSGQK